MRRFCLFFLVVLGPIISNGQQSGIDRPKLVVSIVVDQMRYDYLQRYYAKFGNDGFRRLMTDGFTLRNAHYNYSHTFTGPGHASIFTGTTPAIHGIIGNDWYDKETKKNVNCVEDKRYDAAGVTSTNGKISPSRMLSSTITDELKLFNKQAKVIGLSIKDRSAVLPAGHMADGAFWYDKDTGKFITSTFYMEKVPDWVQQFNNKNLPEIYLSQQWKPLLPIAQYIESEPDLSKYETKFAGKDATFPYDLPEMRKTNKNFDLLPITPFGNDLLTEFAKAALTSEKMGKDAITDFLAISYSSTDRLGHKLGPRAVEVEDMYLKLDKNIGDLLKKLDQEVGANNYIVFLTSDHGVCEAPQFLLDHKMSGGYYNEEKLRDGLKEFLNGYFPGKDLVANVSNNQVFLNHDAFVGAPKTSGVDFFILTELIGKFFMAQDGVANYYTEGVLRQARFDEEGAKGMVFRTYHPKRSGDVVIVLEPGWVKYDASESSSHGSMYPYDTHVPVLFFGKGVKKGSTTRYHSITDIAPTVSMLLNISLPSGCTGKPVSEMFE
jgi:predicted AlkP superfamily pyrophosphatase or phosphodiesterase